MIGACTAWLVPMLFALYVSFRPYAETSQYGYVSLPHHLHASSNYVNAWTQSDMLRFFGNSVLITVPAVILTLLLASMVAFVVDPGQYQGQRRPAAAVHRGQSAAAAGHHHPALPALPAHPAAGLSQLERLLYDSITGLIVINVAFQTGLLRVRAEQLHAHDPR